MIETKWQSPAKEKKGVFEEYIAHMECAIIEDLSKLDVGELKYKWAIESDIGLADDILTILLKRLKWQGRVKLDCICNEDTGKVAGSGYCLTWAERKKRSTPHVG